MKQELIVLDYLQTKLNQAQKDIELFSIMIKEIEDMARSSNKLNLNNQFLKLVVTEGEKNE